MKKKYNKKNIYYDVHRATSSTVRKTFINVIVLFSFDDGKFARIKKKVKERKGKKKLLL